MPSSPFVLTEGLTTSQPSGRRNSTKSDCSWFTDDSTGAKPPGILSSGGRPSLSSFLFQLFKSAAAAGRGRATPAAAPAAQPRARRRVAGAKAAAAGSAHSKQVDAFIGGSERRLFNGHE